MNTSGLEYLIQSSVCLILNMVIYWEKKGKCFKMATWNCVCMPLRIWTLVHYI